MLVVSMKQKYFVHYYIVGYIRVKKNPKPNNQIRPTKRECFIPKHVEHLPGYLYFIATARLILFKQPYR